MTTPVDTVRRFYDALGNGDVPAVLTLLDPQVGPKEKSATFGERSGAVH